MSELIDAAKAGDTARVREILQRQPPAAARRTTAGESALMAALYRGHRDLANEIADAQIAAGEPLDIFAAAALGRIDQLDAALAEPGAVGRALPTTAGPRCTSPRSSASSSRRAPARSGRRASPRCRGIR